MRTSPIRSELHRIDPRDPSMFTLSAFADEISPDPQEQIDVLKPCGVRHIEFRSIHKTNVLALTDAQIREFKALLDARRLQAQRHRLADRQDPDRRAVRAAPGEVPAGDRAVPSLRHAEHPHLQLLPAGRTSTATGPPYRDEVIEPHAAEGRDRREGRRPAAATRTSTASTATRPERRRRPARRRCKSPALRGRVRPGQLRLLRLRPVEGLGGDASRTRSTSTSRTGRPARSTAASPARARARSPTIIADAVKMGYDGFATLEPHLLGGGPTGGVTGPELFPKAVAAFKPILEAAGGQHQ